jgi:hypothetical protein
VDFGLWISDLGLLTTVLQMDRGIEAKSEIYLWIKKAAGFFGKTGCR